MQLPGHHRAAHHQSCRHTEDDRGKSGEHRQPTFGPGITPPPTAQRQAAPADAALAANGPQLPGAAMDQSDIDKLLASFE